STRRNRSRSSRTRRGPRRTAFRVLSRPSLRRRMGTSGSGRRRASTASTVFASPRTSPAPRIPTGRPSCRSLPRETGACGWDAAGSIWAAGQYGFASFQNGKWRRVGTEMGYAAPAAQTLLVDQAGTLWVATDGLNFGLSRDPVRVNTILALARNATHFSPTGD